jgi:hypothetical protein
MTGESNLTVQLKSMHPKLQSDMFVFLTVKDDFPADIQTRAVMVFREREGMTVVISENLAGELAPADHPRWAMVTLVVHSDLNAVGFLAAITQKLAKAGVAVKAVSAFHRDHLFVPWEKRDTAMNTLRTFALMD